MPTHRPRRTRGQPLGGLIHPVLVQDQRTEPALRVFDERDLRIDGLQEKSVSEAANASSRGWSVACTNSGRLPG